MPAEGIGPTFARIARDADAGRVWPACGSWTTSSRSVCNGPPENEMLEGYAALAFAAGVTVADHAWERW